VESAGTAPPKKVSELFTDELTAQLADARSATTAKLDAPVNKLARLLNSPSIKRVLLNDSLRVDLDAVISRQEVLIVKGALGAMGAGNTAVLMQLLLGMLDAALARQQDLVEPAQRVAVALKVDEAPLVINAGFAETMALKRSAGLETLACWQADAQWTDPSVRDQLDALFAHRVYFATASARDARNAAPLSMAEFTDSVRPGMRELSALGRPDARLRLPRHHAIASFTTPDGRLAPFIVRTVPMRVDRERIALHAARQRARGGQPLVNLRREHWSRSDDVVASGATERSGSAEPAAASRPRRPTPPTLPALGPEPAPSYAELVELDRAHSVRVVARRDPARGHEPDPIDRAILLLLGRLGHLLSTQIHRRFNPGRAATTTQRRLKRLADAGLVDRVQFHRRDGGGVPMCYRLADAGRDLLASELATAAEDRPSKDLAQVRHELHVAGWALAVERALDVRLELQGESGAALSPPRGASGGPLGPQGLKLPDGRVPHDFLTSDGSARIEVERFEPVRPDALVRTQSVDLMVERDDRLPDGPAATKLERYDHLLTGWSCMIARYGPSGRRSLTAVFVCRTRERARELARRADPLLCACRAYAGEYPFEWEYHGRERIVFAAERDAHEGHLTGYGVPRLPPSVRVRAAHGDPRASQPAFELRRLIDRGVTGGGEVDGGDPL
jgi:Replication-relaxation